MYVPATTPEPLRSCPTANVPVPCVVSVNTVPAIEPPSAPVAAAATALLARADWAYTVALVPALASARLNWNPAVECTWSESARVLADPDPALAPYVTAPGMPEPGIACW